MHKAESALPPCLFLPCALHARQGISLGNTNSLGLGREKPAQSCPRTPCQSLPTTTLRRVLGQPFLSAAFSEYVFALLFPLPAELHTSDLLNSLPFKIQLKCHSTGKSSAAGRIHTPLFVWASLVLYSSARWILFLKSLLSPQEWCHIYVVSAVPKTKPMCSGH